MQQKIKDTEDYEDLVVLDNLSQELVYTNIKTVVSLFENLEEIPLSSRQLKGVLHSHGVNMRYLGRVASQLAQHHIKSLCLTEMIARTAKNLYNEQISKQIRQLHSNPPKSGQPSGTTSPPLTTVPTHQVNIWTVDFLNLLLG